MTSYAPYADTLTPYAIRQHYLHTGHTNAVRRHRDTLTLYAISHPSHLTSYAPYADALTPYEIQQPYTPAILTPYADTTTPSHPTQSDTLHTWHPDPLRRHPHTLHTDTLTPYTLTLSHPTH